MKVLHVFTKMNYVYTEALIKMFYENFHASNDFFICDLKDNVPQSIQSIDKKGSRIFYLKQKNTKVQFFELKKYFKNYDYVIYHFLPNDIFLHIYYFFNNKALGNVVWRIWGADLYNWKKEKKFYKFINYIRGFTRKHINYVIAEPMDIPEYKKQFGDNCIFLCGPDPKGYDEIFLKQNKKPKKEKAVNILIGHSAVKTLNHIEVMSQLLKFKEENIKIILPLNYGDNSYRDKIKEYALENFDEKKIEFIFEKMTLEQYIQLLWQTDIAIFHSDRQIAMGNITMLLYMQKKIFLKKNSVMDNYYRINEKLEIYNSCEIKNQNFSEFIYNNNNNNLVNKKFAQKEIDINSIVEDWKNTFKKLEERRN